MLAAASSSHLIKSIMRAQSGTQSIKTAKHRHIEARLERLACTKVFYCLDLKIGKELVLSQKIFSNEQMAHRDKDQTLRVLRRHHTRKVAPSRSHTLLISTGGA